MLDTTGYAKGDELGAQIGISRAAVWKQLHRLIELGAPIETVHGKGYRLLEPLQLLDASRIYRSLAEAGRKLPIELFESIESTNAYGRDLPASEIPRLVIAEHQVAGRGRFQRNWVSPFGRNLYFTLVQPMPGDLGRFGGLSLAVGLALHAEVVKAVEATGGDGTDIRLKWPNDLYWRDRKVAGILIEARAELNGGVVLIVGLGLNVNMLPEHVGEKLPPWTSLQMITGESLDRSELAGAIAVRLLDYLELFGRSGFAPFRAAWHEVDYLAGSDITVSQPTGTISGRADGVSESGELLLTLESGERIEVTAGDTLLQRR